MALNHDSTPLLEYHKAKKRHWDPRDLDFAQDQQDWAALGEHDRAGTLQLCTLFLVGEEAVTHDLAPLLVGIRQRGGALEEEIFLATQLYEEAKHVEFFDRWLSEVAAADDLRAQFATPSYQRLFGEQLPQALAACLTEPTARVLAVASATYHMIVEGVMAETGYHLFAQAMRARGLFPGLLLGVQRVQQDEARHIAFGLYLIRRLVREEPEIWPEVGSALNSGIVLAMGALSEAFQHWGDDVPFGLSQSEALAYASRQFTHRFAALTRNEPS